MIDHVAIQQKIEQNNFAEWQILFEHLRMKYYGKYVITDCGEGVVRGVYPAKGLRGPKLHIDLIIGNRGIKRAPYKVIIV